MAEAAAAAAAGGDHGYWEPHTSSIDFCEPNYQHTRYVAELHNSWSSLWLSFLPLVGLLYSNPTRELRFVLMYVVLIIVGLGSVALHATIKAFPQSLDEVPMLWMNFLFFFAMLEQDSSRGKPKHPFLPFVLSLLVVLITVLYYRFQQIYEAFLYTYTGLVVIIVLWTAKLVLLDDNKAKASEYLGKTTLRKWLWTRAVLSYLLIGLPLWVLEMKQCNLLLPYYTAFGGLSFHTRWHLGAGLGTYLTILLLIVMRLQGLGIKADIVYLPHPQLPLLPIVTAKTTTTITTKTTTTTSPRTLRSNSRQST